MNVRRRRVPARNSERKSVLSYHFAHSSHQIGIPCACKHDLRGEAHAAFAAVQLARKSGGTVVIETVVLIYLGNARSLITRRAGKLRHFLPGEAVEYLRPHLVVIRKSARVDESFGYGFTHIGRFRN